MRGIWKQRADEGGSPGPLIAAALEEVAPVGGAPDTEPVRGRVGALWELVGSGDAHAAAAAVAELRTVAHGDRRAPRSDGLGAETAMALSALAGQLGEPALAVTAAERAELLAQATRRASLMAGAGYWQARAYLGVGRVNDAAWSAAEGCRTVEGTRPDDLTHGACALIAAVAAARAGREEAAASFLAKAQALAESAGSVAPDPWRTGFGADQVAGHAARHGLTGPPSAAEVAPQPAS